MATLTDQDIQDLVVGTLKELGRLKFNQIAQRLQEYEVFSKIMKKDKVSFDGGVGVQRSIMIDHSSAAKNVGLYEVDDVNVNDVLVQINIPWRHTTTNWAFERREILMNSGGYKKIVDLLKVRRTDGMLSLVELMEEDFWSKPADSSDEVKPFGIKYWVVPNATEGFNGGNPSGFTAGAGNLNATTYPRWKNYTAQYTDVTKADLIKKMRTAYRKIRFKSPIQISDFRKGTGEMYRLYTNETLISSLEDIGEAQNENLGRDLASMDGEMVFRKNPIKWIPQLDEDSTNPLYMVNWNYFCPVFLKGDYLRESDPMYAPNQHNTKVVHVDCTYNYLCTDRRRQAHFQAA